MFIPFLSILLLVSNTFASPLTIEKRDDAEVRASLTRLSEAVKDATQFLKGRYHLNGKWGFFDEAIQRQRNFNSLARDETSRILRAPSLSTFEWIGLGTITFPLGKNHQEFANAWIALRDASVPRDQEVLSVLQETLSDGIVYMDTLWAKTNGLNGALTNTMRTQFGTYWNQAIQAYKTSSNFGGVDPFTIQNGGSQGIGSQGNFPGGGGIGTYQGGNQGGIPAPYQGSNQGGYYQGNNQPGGAGNYPGSYQGSNQGGFGGIGGIQGNIGGPAVVASTQTTWR